MNCIYTASDRNIQLRDGCLALTARRESDSYRHNNVTNWYTSAKITSNQDKGFGFGYVEIRAALPRGKMLSPEIKIYNLGTFTVYLIGNYDANSRFQDDRYE